MDGRLKLSVLERGRRGAPEPSAEQKLLEEIRDVCRMIDRAYRRFEFEEDGDLVEASIYELESLKARYRYLIRQAKEKNITSEGFGAMGAERGRAEPMG